FQKKGSFHAQIKSNIRPLRCLSSSGRQLGEYSERKAPFTPLAGEFRACASLKSQPDFISRVMFRCCVWFPERLFSVAKGPSTFGHSSAPAFPFPPVMGYIPADLWVKLTTRSTPSWQTGFTVNPCSLLVPLL